MNKNKVFAVLVCLYVLFPLYSQTEITDALGRKFVYKCAAQRVVSLSPAVTEILFAVGAVVVGRTEYCNYPSAVSSVPVVGGFSGATVSVEQIAALKPDVVIVSADMHQRLIPLLEGLGIPAFTVEPRNFDEVYAVIGVLGRLTGREQDAAGVVQTMKTKIEQVQKRVRGKKAPSVFWELYDTPLMTCGGNTFVSEAIQKAGGRNIFEHEKTAWIEVSFEQVLFLNPDWILSGSDHSVTVTANPLWKTVSAVKNNRIAAVDADTVYRYGPRLADAVTALARILHP
ncbi:MAG: ABC transporter substrate-binding protein [Treponema sp.]|jgi:iron complex transport system substrate-binding protein|nr:ABC transporter substrate-binding protein [Treponema sp.]